MSLVEKYAGLEEPIKAGSLQCTDIVSTYEDGHKTHETQVQEELRVKKRFKALKEGMKRLLMEQVLLESFLVEEHQESALHEKHARLQELKGAKKKELKDLKAEYDEVKRLVKAWSASVIQAVAQYEVKRKTLCEKLGQLREKEEAYPDKENLTIMQNKLKSKQEEAERLDQQKHNLGSELQGLEETFEQLSKQLHELQEKADSKATDLDGIDMEAQQMDLTQLEEQIETVMELGNVLESLCGVRVSDFDVNFFRVSIDSENISINLNFDANTKLVDADLEENHDVNEPARVLETCRYKFTQKIIKEAVRRNDVSFLIREIRSFVLNSRALDKELNILRNRNYEVISGANAWEVVVKAKFNRAVATFELSPGYPGIHFPPHVSSISDLNGNEMAPSAVEEVVQQHSSYSNAPCNTTTITDIIRNIAEKQE